MAVRPKDIPVTRDDVAGWLNIHRNWPANAGAKPGIRDFLLQRLKAKGQDTVDVDTSGHDDKPDHTPLVDMIVEDLISYG